MVSRLQQLITVGGVGAATLWAWLALTSGHPVAAAAGVTAIFGAHALVLAAEFVALRYTHGNDPTPAASAAQLWRAWRREVICAVRVFCWRQPFFSQRWPDHLPNIPRRGVLLIHGFVCNRGVWNPWLKRLAAQGVPTLAINLEPVFGSIDSALPIIEQAVRRLERATGLAPLIVAHSMGGLALRRWWSEQRDHQRIHHAITIATPHHGTWLARFGTTLNARQMRQDSPWLQTLMAREPAGRASRFTCFYSHCDNIVFPPSVATLTGADNRHLVGEAHLCMVYRDEPWQALQELLEQP